MSLKVSQQPSGTGACFPLMVMLNRRSRISDDVMSFIVHGVLDFLTTLNKKFQSGVADGFRSHDESYTNVLYGDFGLLFLLLRGSLYQVA